MVVLKMKMLKHKKLMQIKVQNLAEKILKTLEQDDNRVYIQDKRKITQM